MATITLILATLTLAWLNGANDNFKGVATLFGSGTTNYRKALLWATGCTLAGALSAVWLAGTLVKNFSGKGLVPEATTQMPAFFLAVMGGALIALAVATLLGMPISTTHSLIGGLIGSGLMMDPVHFQASRLGSVFLLPLLLSPLAAIALGHFFYRVCHWARQHMGIDYGACVCVGNTWRALAPQKGQALAMEGTSLHLSTGQKADCTMRYQGRFIGMDAQSVVDVLHYLSAGWLSFSRGLNDAPKIAGMLLFTTAFGLSANLTMIGLAMAAGGLLNASRVAHTISKKVTPMNSGQGLSANLSAATLVSLASIFGLPVSTTHVSVGAIFGISAITKQANIKMVASIITSWILTLPVAALGSGLIAWLIQ